MRLSSVIAASLVLLVASVAHAQDARTVAAARAAFEQGVDALDAGRFDEAVRSLEHSLALRESPAARYNLALAHRGTGHPLRAIQELRRLLANRADAAAQMLDDAARVLQELERSLAHAQVRVVGSPTEVAVDGEPVAPLAAQRVDLDPGAHTFTARGAGRAPVTVSRTLAAGEDQTVVLDLSRGAASPAHLAVTVATGGALVSVDGGRASPAPLELELSAGHHVVRVSAPGHETRTTELDLVGGQRRDLDVPLAASHGGSVLDEWWFWTVIGVVVVGAAVGLTLALTTENVQPPLPGTDGATLMTLVAP